jgi:hypothetical protein
LIQAEEATSEMKMEIIRKLITLDPKIGRRAMRMLLSRPDLFTSKQNQILKDLKIDILDPKSDTIEKLSLGEIKKALSDIPENVIQFIKIGPGSKLFNDPGVTKEDQEAVREWRTNYVAMLNNLKEIWSDYSSENKQELVRKLDTAKKTGDFATILDEYNSTDGTNKEKLNNILTQAKELDPTVEFKSMQDLKRIQGLLRRKIESLKKRMGSLRSGMSSSYDAWKKSKDPIVALAAMVVEKLSDTDIEKETDTTRQYDIGTVEYGKTTFNVVVFITFGNTIEAKITPLSGNDPFAKKRTIDDILGNVEEPEAEKANISPPMSEDIVNHVRNIICEAEGIAPSEIKKSTIQYQDMPTYGGKQYPSWHNMIESLIESNYLKDWDKQLEETEGGAVGMQIPILRDLQQNLNAHLNNPDTGQKIQKWIIHAFEKYGGWYNTQRDMINRNKNKSKEIKIKVPHKMADGHIEEVEEVTDFNTFMNQVTDRLNTLIEKAVREGDDYNVLKLTTLEHSKGLTTDEQEEVIHLKDTLDELYQKWGEGIVSPTEEWTPRTEAQQRRNKDRYPAHWEITIYIPQSEFFDMASSRQIFKTNKATKDDLDADLVDFISGHGVNLDKNCIKDLAKIIKTYAKGPKEGPVPAKVTSAMSEIGLTDKSQQEIIQKIIDTPASLFSAAQIKDYIKKNGKLPPGVYSAGNTFFNGRRLFTLIKGALEGSSKNVPDMNLSDRAHKQIASDVATYVFDNLIKKKHNVEDISQIYGTIISADPKQNIILAKELKGKQIKAILADPHTTINIGGRICRPKYHDSESGQLTLQQELPPELMRAGVSFCITKLPEPKIFDVNGKFYRTYIMPSNGDSISVDRAAGQQFKWNKVNIDKYSKKLWEKHEDILQQSYDVWGIEEFRTEVDDTEKIRLFEYYFKGELRDEQQIRNEMYISLPITFITSGVKELPDKSDPEKYHEVLHVIESKYWQIEEQLVEQLKNPKIVGFIAELRTIDTFQSNDLINHNINMREDISIEIFHGEQRIGQFNIESFDSEEGVVQIQGIHKTSQEKMRVGDRFVISNIDVDVDDLQLRDYQKHERSIFNIEFFQNEKNRLKYGLPDTISGEESPNVHMKFTQYITRLHKEYTNLKSDLAGGPIADDFFHARKQLIQSRRLNFIAIADRLGIDSKRAAEIFKQLLKLYDPAIVCDWGERLNSGEKGDKGVYMTRDRWFKEVFGDNKKLLLGLLSGDNEQKIKELKLIKKHTRDYVSDLFDGNKEITGLVKRTKEEKIFPGQKDDVIRSQLKLLFNYDRLKFLNGYLQPLVFNNDRDAMIEWMRTYLPHLVKDSGRRRKFHAAKYVSDEATENYKIGVYKVLDEKKTELVDELRMPAATTAEAMIKAKKTYASQYGTGDTLQDKIQSLEGKYVFKYISSEELEKDEEEEDEQAWKQLKLEDVLNQLEEKFAFQIDPTISKEENEVQKQKLQNELDEVEETAKKAWNSNDNATKEAIYDRYLMSEHFDRKLYAIMEDVIRLTQSAPIRLRAVLLYENDDLNNLRKLQETAINHHNIASTFNYTNREIIMEYLLEHMV